jgi:tetratricopeptide (TPR) repeat protein
MNRVEKAIESGRCALAVGGSLLRDPEVMLALTERAGLSPMALAGQAVLPVVPVSAGAASAALSQPGGLLVLVEPEGSDTPGISKLSELVQRARHRPDVIVVSRAFNPFAFGAALGGLNVSHEKARGKAFIQGLPGGIPPSTGPIQDGAPTHPASSRASKKDDGIAAPRFSFVGRDEEVDALAALLAEGGPIVVSGPPGVGRTQLVEHAVKKAQANGALERFPDLYLGWGSGADTLAARLAGMGRHLGDTRLWDLLVGPHTPADVVRVASELVADEKMAGKLFVVHNLEFGLGRENDFFRRSRLELMLIALLTQPAAMPIVFISTRQPRFHREGEGAALRRVAVGGIKGRFFHEIFDAYKAIEFPREKFGPISDRLHGHPMAARMFAIATRTRQDGADLVDDPKFLSTDSLEDVGPLERHIQRRMEKLGEQQRVVLARLAHLRTPVDGTMLANELGVTRQLRLELLSLGLLDMVGTEEDRRYRVHPLVRAQLQWREVSDFTVSEKLADLYMGLASKAEGLQRLVLEQEQNRFAVGGRNLKLRARLELPDHDMWLESVTGMLRAKQPRLDLVDQRLNECLKQNPANSDAWLLRLELAQHPGASSGPPHDKAADAMEPILEEAIAKAPVPELFQQVVSSLLGRRQRARAITVIEKGLEIFPGESRLHTRLAAVLLRLGRRLEAMEHLRRAMEIDPMLPDSYGLLGMARRDEGAEALPEAESLLREAVRLAPGDPVQLSRLVDLLLDQARVDADRSVALRDEARALLEDAIKGERRAPEACLLFATLLREEGGDLERAGWLLGQAKKLTDRGHERARRIVVEHALIDMAKGDLNAAETALRQHVARDPSHARGFAALGHVLEAREQFLPAHAEYKNARDRTAQNGLEWMFYDQQLRRVAAIIEAQAAGLWTPATRPEPAPQPPPPSNRVLRRRGQAADAGGTSGAEAANAGESGGADDGWADDSGGDGHEHARPAEGEGAGDDTSASGSWESAPTDEFVLDAAPVEEAVLHEADETDAAVLDEGADPKETPSFEPPPANADETAAPVEEP